MNELRHIHDFKTSLALSHAQADNPLWERVYRKAFPTMIGMNYIRDEGWAQQGGIDRAIILASGKVLYVDEKIRGKAYDDVLLEYWSVLERRKLGWIEKELACDYIAYAVKPRNLCYLLPFQSLRSVWRRNRREWADKYRRIHAPNHGYTTVSLAVPVDVLMDAIRDSMTVSWDGDA